MLTSGEVGGGASSGSSNNGSMSTVSKAEVIEQDYVGLSEASSSSYPQTKPEKRLQEDVAEEADGRELELGLGLGLGMGGTVRPCAWGDYCRILTAKDFPSSSPSARAAVAGTKRAADSVAQELGSNSPGQVVGWPPIRAFRMNSLVNQAKAISEDSGTDNHANPNYKKSAIKTNSSSNDKIMDINNHCNAKKEKTNGKSQFVKVNMDGVPIGRKVDLNAHVSYYTLAQALEDMFRTPTSTRTNGSQEVDGTVEATKSSKLLDGSSEFVLTYEDREGDCMLVGDVPWGMFLSTVKRLRIMRTSDDTGLGKCNLIDHDKPTAKLLLDAQQANLVSHCSILLAARGSSQALTYGDIFDIAIQLVHPEQPKRQKFKTFLLLLFYLIFVAFTMQLQGFQKRVAGKEASLFNSFKTSEQPQN